MKKLTFLVIALLAVTFVFAQEKNKLRVIIIKPKADMTMEFEKGLTAHMAKYHPKATDPVSIFQVMSGTHSGEFHYVQGGLSWGDMEGKQYGGDHSDDWNKNVGKYISSSETHYLAAQDAYSYNVNPGNADWLLVYFITLKQDMNGVYMDMMKTRKDVYTKAKDGRNFQVFSHAFSGTNDEFSYVYVSDLVGGLKDMDTNNPPFAKLLNEQVGPYAQQDWARNAEMAVKKVEAMLVHRMVNMSSK